MNSENLVEELLKHYDDESIKKYTWIAQVQLLTIYKSASKGDKNINNYEDNVHDNEEKFADSKRQRVTASREADGGATSSDAISSIPTSELYGENTTADEFISSIDDPAEWDLSVSEEFWSGESLDAIHLSGNIREQVKEMIDRANNTGQKFLFNLKDNQMIIWCKRKNSVDSKIKLTLYNVQVKYTQKGMFTTILDHITKECDEIVFPNVVSEILRYILEKNSFENTNERMFVWSRPSV